MMTAKEIFEQLNVTDEIDIIEAKPGKSIFHSVMETVCAFANEPGLGGGYILLGAMEEEGSLFPSYIVDEVIDPDKLQSDFASQCGSMFNMPIRPSIKIEQVNGKNVAVIRVDELPDNQKPLYFKNEKLPSGAYRRVGPTDHRCTEDDLHVFYADRSTYDKSLVIGTSIKDIDETALNRYRTLREKVNPAAEELTYSDTELLQSLGCLENEKNGRLSIAGLLLFGKSSSLRREFPMMRADYIRVPGNQWVDDPDDRFSSIDMRGSLILLLYRIVNAIYSDLPKAFRIEDDGLQADSVGLPVKVLREAITNALMHRSYRTHSPIQIIRYDNRIEIINPGYSLKADDKLGTPGSETRNPYISAVFHETNLAETKGSGIRAMRRLLAASHLAPPTFESNRTDNKFSARLLLHHFLSKEDLQWLEQYSHFNLNDNQKRALIFVREVGAVDNPTYRQMSDTDSIKSTTELRQLRELELLEQKGKGRGTYYIPGKRLVIQENGLTTHAEAAITQGEELTTHGGSLITHGKELITHGENPITYGSLTIEDLPAELRAEVSQIGTRASKENLSDCIIKLCKWRELSASQLSMILGKGEKHIRREYLKPLIDDGKIQYKYPDMIKHPDQAYKTIVE